MAVSRVPSPPLPEVNTPVAENWCYTQVRKKPIKSTKIPRRRNKIDANRIWNSGIVVAPTKKVDSEGRSADAAAI
jgi:hypothetical protein